MIELSPAARRSCVPRLGRAGHRRSSSSSWRGRTPARCVWSKPPNRDISCCYRPLTAFPCLRVLDHAGGHVRRDRSARGGGGRPRTDSSDARRPARGGYRDGAPPTQPPTHDTHTHTTPRLPTICCESCDSEPALMIRGGLMAGRGVFSGIRGRCDADAPGGGGWARGHGAAARRCDAACASCSHCLCLVFSLPLPCVLTAFALCSHCPRAHSVWSSCFTCLVQAGWALPPAPRETRTV